VEQGEASTIYVPVRWLAENLGLDWLSQYRRIRRDDVLRLEMRGIVVMTTPQDADQHGGRQEMTCIPIDLVPGWLFGIQTGRVKEKTRPK